MALTRPSPSTEPLARGVIIHALQKALVAMWGEGELARVVSALPEHVAQVTYGAEFEPLRWYPAAYLCAWHEAVYAGPARRNDASYARYMDRALDITVGRMRWVLMKIITPSMLAQRANDLWRYFHTHGELSIDWTRPDGIGVRLRDHPFLDDTLGRLTVAEMLRYMLALSRVKNVRQTHAVDASGALVMAFRWDTTATRGSFADAPLQEASEKAPAWSPTRSVRPRPYRDEAVRTSSPRSTMQGESVRVPPASAQYVAPAPTALPHTEDRRFDDGEPFGRYTILSRIGEGGMGVVYRAHDTHLDRRIALKLLRTDISAASLEREDAATRLLREGRAAAALSHPNVVTVFDVGEWRGTHYIAMELVDGQTLRTKIGDPSIGIDTRVRWLIEIATALAEAHARGIVHRDVKPENVIVGGNGAVKVLDFGIARRATGGVPMTSSSNVRRESTIFGSPMYMAPEQLRGEAIDGAADQFAWALLAYELLTGHHPWESATSDVELARWILGTTVKRPSTFEPALPLRVDEAISRALRKNPAHRFATMREVIEQLRNPGDDEARVEGLARGPAANFGHRQRAVTTRTFEVDVPGKTVSRGPRSFRVAMVVLALMLAIYALWRGFRP